METRGNTLSRVSFVFTGFFDRLRQRVFRSIGPPEPQFVVVIMNPAFHVMAPTVDPCTSGTSRTINVINIMS